jgi:cytochrome oxidase assembly protein ShyY1
MYAKKLTYSFFTIPVAVISYNMYDWQRRRMKEKLRETEIRTNRIIEDAVDIQSFYNPRTDQKFPWIGLNLKELNNQFAWKTIELNGQFDHSSQVLVTKIKDGEEGFDVITPFYCYSDENGKVQPVLVNRGWIPYDARDRYDHWINSIGPISIKGLVYKGDESHKYSKDNEMLDGKFYTLKPEEISTFLTLPNRQVSSKFVIKQLEFNPINKSALPVVFNVENLGHFPISATTNGQYANLWKALTFFNIFTNMLVWVYF